MKKWEERPEQVRTMCERFPDAGLRFQLGARSVLPFLDGCICLEGHLETQSEE